MKDIKKYIKEGFFSNVKADNPCKHAIDYIRELSLEDTSVSYNNITGPHRKQLTNYLTEIEQSFIKGEVVFSYIIVTNYRTRPIKITITLSKGPDSIRWTFKSTSGASGGWEAKDMAHYITCDLDDEKKYSKEEAPHSIADTIKIEKFNIIK